MGKALGGSSTLSSVIPWNKAPMLPFAESEVVFLSRSPFLQTMLPKSPRFDHFYPPTGITLIDALAEVGLISDRHSLPSYDSLFRALTAARIFKERSEPLQLSVRILDRNWGPNGNRARRELMSKRKRKEKPGADQEGSDPPPPSTPLILTLCVDVMVVWSHVDQNPRHCCVRLTYSVVMDTNFTDNIIKSVMYKHLGVDT